MDVPDETWVTDGDVHSVDASADGATLFLGGEFSFLGAPTGGAVPLDGAARPQAGAWPAVSGGAVEAIVPDGAGGWFLGGSFTHVDGMLRPHLVHVSSTGMVDPTWGGKVDGKVHALELLGGKLFVGGAFERAGGVVHPNLAVFDAQSGSHQASWPAVTSTTTTGAAVRAIDATGGTLVVAGAFSHAGSEPRANIAAIDTTTGQVTAWDPSVSGGSVHAVAIHQSTVFVGGNFLAVRGVARTRIAAIDLASGAPTAWAPVANAEVRALFHDGTWLYVGGAFTSFGGSTTSRFLVRSNGAAATPVDSWAPAFHDALHVEDLLVRGTEVTVGGRIAARSATYGGSHRSVLSFSTASVASAGSFAPRVEGPVLAFGWDGTTTYLGGAFTTVGGVPRSNLAALERGTGRLTAWDPSVVGNVLDLDFDTAAGLVYVVGTLNRIGGLDYSGSQMARIRLDGSADTSWSAPSPTYGLVTDISLGADHAYIGGTFEIGQRSKVAAIFKNGNVDHGFDPGVMGLAVHDIDASGGNVVIGGDFVQVDTVTRINVALLDGSTGNPLAWNVLGIDGPVHAVDHAGTTIYVGGMFTMPRPHIVAADAATGAIKAFSAPVPGPVFAVDATASAVYVASMPLPQELSSTGSSLGWSPQPLVGEPRDVHALGDGAVFTGAAHAWVSPRVGIALYSARGTDTHDPLAAVTGITEAISGTSPDDGTFVAGPDVVYARTTGATLPRFTVNVRAHDRYGSAATSYAAVSGLARVTWGAVPSTMGTWTSDATSPGAPRGLLMNCWDARTPEEGPWLGRAIDRNIAYRAAVNPPDLLPQLPAVLASDQLPGPNYDDLSCRWRGHLIAPDAATSLSLQSHADNGFRASVAGIDVLDPLVTEGFTTIYEWANIATSTGTAAEPLAASESRAVVAEWFEGTGEAHVELRWNQGVAGAWEPIPEGAFVTRVNYRNAYSLDAPITAMDGPTSLPVSAVDRSGRTHTTSATVVVDNTPPPGGTLTTSASTGWTSGPIDVLVDDLGADQGSGIYVRRIERRSIPMGADLTCDVAAATEAGWAPVQSFTGTTTGRTFADALAAGECHQYRYVSIDNVGNPHRDAPTGWIRVDTTPIDPAAASLSYDGGWTSTSTATLTFTPASDPESGQHWRIRRDDAPLNGDGTCGVFSSVDSPPDPTSPYSDALVPGTCTQFALVTTSGAGTTHAAGPGALIKVDATPPTGSITTSSTIPLSGSTTIDAVTADSSGQVASAQLSYTGPTSGTICGTATAGGAFSCPWDTSLLDGTYDVTLLVRDAAGNSSTTTASFIVDNTAPTYSPTTTISATSGSVHPSADGSTTWFDPDDAGSFTWDPGIGDGTGSGIASVTWSPDPMPAGFTLSTTTTPVHTASVSWNPGAIADGTSVPLTVTVMDAAGNESSRTLLVVADNAPPTGGSISYAGGTGTVPSITIDVGSDAGSALRLAELLREEAPRSGGTCGVWSAASVRESWDLRVVPSTIPAPYEDVSVQRDRCYRYSLRVTDNVGNSAAWGPGAEFHTEGAGIVVEPAVAGATTVTEGAAAGIVLKVRLRVKPTSDVTVSVAGDGQAVATPTSLTFTTANWNVARDVTVVARDDRLDEPAMSAGVTFSVDAPTADTGYDALASSTASIQVEDDDVPAIVVDVPPSGLAVAEPGSSVTYGVRLATQPHASVKVAIAAPSGQVALSSTTPLTFTSADWQVAQQVTVRAVEDPDVEGPHAAPLSHVASGSGADSGYQGVAAARSVTITDDDRAGFTVASADGATVEEADPTTTHPVGVRLTARPASPVTIDVAVPDGQVAATPAQLTFTPADWDVVQRTAVGAVPDTAAEANPHGSTVGLRASSSDPAWASIDPSSVAISVRDDDPAAFVTSPGARWTLNDDGHLLLEETATLGSIIRIRAVGDPTRDVRVTPVLSPEGQLSVTPASAVIPAGSTGTTVTFSVRAVSDDAEEAAVHAARIGWRITTEDPRYTGTAIAATFARITDTPKRTVREETTDAADPTPNTTTTTTDGGGGDAGTTGNGSGTTDTATTPPADTTGDATTGGRRADPAPTEETGDTGGQLIRKSGTAGDDPSKEQASRSAEEDEGGAITKRVRRMKQWASENKGKAAVAASASGSAAIWAAAKPLAMAGKALSAGGGLNTPPGMGQLRHLAKLRGRRMAKSKLRRFWRGKRRRIDRDDLPDEDDWDDFLWGDRAA